MLYEVITGYAEIGNVSSIKALPSGVLLETQTAKVEITFFNENTIKVRIARGTLPRDFSYAVSAEPAKCTVVLSGKNPMIFV